MNILKTIKMSILSFLFINSSFAVAPDGSFDEVSYILKRKCVECHRPGEVAPMSFDSYESIRPWAKSILKEVESKNMPPWFASPDHGSFTNENKLTKEEIELIKKWVVSGAPKGNISNFDMLKGFSEGWQIGNPDMVFEMSDEFKVPAEGSVDYQYFRVPSNFTEDKWIRSFEARPGDRSVVHHIIVFLAPHGESLRKGGATSGMIGGFAPGLKPINFSNSEIGIKIPANSDFIFQIHYTAKGQEATDKSKIGIIFHEGVPRYRHITEAIPNLSIKIPAGDPDYKVETRRKFSEDTQIVSLMPHMHLRGKSFKYTLIRSDGNKEILLDVGKYDFNWQISYILSNPLYVRSGDTILCEAIFDNSSNNPNNPDPSKEVRWGDQTWEEMMIGWFSKIEANQDFKENLDYSQQSFKIDALMAEQRTLLTKIGKGKN